MLARSLLIVLGFFMLGGGAALAADQEAFAEIYAEMSLRMPTTSLLVACHGFSCRNQAQIILSNGDRAMRIRCRQGARSRSTATLSPTM